jgi:proliferating cell nuclear antigen
MTFEARSKTADMWKKTIDAVKDLVQEGNLQCNNEGITLQAMDTAHVALVSLQLKKSAFTQYHMETDRALGINMANLAKVLKTIDAKDSLILRHVQDENTLQVCAEDPEASKSKKKAGAGDVDVTRRTTEYSLKLMEIESEEMGVPDMEYKCQITMPTSEFARICRDMNVLGDTITLKVSREGVEFSADGDLGQGKHVYKCPVSVSRAGFDAALPEVKQEVKQEVKREVKREADDDSDDNNSSANNSDDDDEPLVNRLKDNKKDGAASGGKKGKAAADDEEKKEKLQMKAFYSEPVELSFALRYFTIFSKAANLSETVTLSLSAEHPCQIEYNLEKVGHLRFFLAPKVEAGE